jgi:phosphoribosylformylglycinamidine synthase subunit PurQ / glutaminase
MATPRICVLRAPGTNCDLETAHAFELAGGDAERMHLFRLLENPRRLAEFQVLCIPGGFSYGDDVGAGVVFGSQLQGHLGEAVGEFLQADKLVLGICNGFQTLLKAGILPGGATNGDASTPAASNNSVASQATLTWNENGHYTALWVHLVVGTNRSVFLRGLDRIELPVAHAEGRIAVTDAAVIEQWQENAQVALRYVSETGQEQSQAASVNLLPYPVNPNGSVANIAGLSDPTGRVLGLMPHPERFIHATQHPQWTRRRLSGEGTGLKFFRNAVDYFA